MESGIHARRLAVTQASDVNGRELSLFIVDRSRTRDWLRRICDVKINARSKTETTRQPTDTWNRVTVIWNRRGNSCNFHVAR